MILIQIYRIAQCEICHGQWALDPRLEISNPDECQICGSRDWLWGPEPLDSRFIRQGISKKSRKVNPGASSRKRQEQGKSQWRKFRSKENQVKAVDAAETPKDN